MHKFASIAIGALALLGQCGGSALAQSAADDKQWSVQCDKQQCQLYAEIRLQNGQLFNNIMFRKLENGVYAGILKLPLGLHIPSGIKIGIDDDALIDAKLITCRNDGCEAAFGASEEVVGYFKRGRQMSVVITKSSTRKRLALNYSLMGFTRNWNEFEARSNPL